MIAKEKIQSYRENLENDRRKLAHEIEAGKKREDFGSDVDSFDEETDEAEEFSTQLGIEKTLKERIHQIDAALERIRLGTYGICEQCGGAISEKILDIVPESALCEKCKKKI